MPKNLRTFLDEIGAALHRPAGPLSTVHEITALQYALNRLARHPVLRIDGALRADGEPAAMPVVTNLGASRELTARALGVGDHRQFAAAYHDRVQSGIEPVIVTALEAPVHQVVLEGEEADLTRLPALTQHEGDPGPYLTAAHATTRDPESGVDNTAIQRCWIKGPRFMSYFPYPASHNARNLRKYWAQGKPCPVAFWIGHHPSVMLGSQAKLRYPESHWAAAGGMAGEPVRLTPTVTHGEAVVVPADAEIVIEGWVPPGEMRADGPFGEYTGYMGPQVPAPVCEITAITHREDALYHDFGSGLPDALTPENMITEAKLYGLVKRVAPSLVNVHVPNSGRRFHVYLQLDRPAPGEARDALAAAISYRRTKAAFAFDTDIDIFDEAETLWAVATRVQWDRDSFVVSGLQTSLLDPSLAAGAKTGAKIGVDASLPPSPGGDAPHPVPPRSKVPNAALTRAREFLRAADADDWPRL